VEALLALDEIMPAAVADVMATLGGQIKLGQAYDLLYNAFIAEGICTFESFKTFVMTELPPLFAVAEEEVVEEPPMKHSSTEEA
jgi:hypothetical protein